MAFKEGNVAIRLKHSFVYILWSYNKEYLGEEVHSLIGFLQWMTSS